MAGETIQRVRHERLPWPIGLSWVAAHRAQHAMGVFGSVEVTIRVMFAMVLSDVLDLDWPEKLEQRLRQTEDNRGVERMAFGTRVDMLRLALKLHAGAKGRVLPDLQPWWSGAEGPLLELVQARNQVTHLAALEEVDPTDARRRFAQFLSSARWLEQVQLIHVERVTRERGRFSTHLYRLRGVAPWNELSLELDTSFSAPIEGNSIYLGNAAGAAWTLAPFFSARRRSAAVFDGLDKRGNPLFFDPTRPPAEALEAAEGFPLPGQEWQLAGWPEFLTARRRTSAWRVSEPRPDALLQLPVTADVTLAPGTRLDYLELVEPLGEGGFATVWRANDLHTGAQVAVKVLRPDVGASERELARFEEEVALLRRLHAQGCRRLIGPVEAFRAELGGERRLVLKMPLLAGTVAQAAEALRSDGGAPTTEQVTRWGLEALEAIADLHARGVVHRDVKPSNLLLDAEGHVVLADLGIARDLQRDARVTRTGEALGSDLYMAPEQRRSSRPVTGKADLFALAGTLHELLTGEEPVLPGKGVPGPLGEALRRMATVDPEERPDAQQAITLLGSAALPPRRAQPRRHRLGAVLGGVTVGLLALLAAAGPSWRGATAVCADGQVTAPAECDDGNTIDGDLCSARCTWNVAVLPSGSFVMGYTEADLDAGMHLATQSRRPPAYVEDKARYATPATPVRVRAFGIMRTEVSNAAFDLFVADTGYGRLEQTDRTATSKRWHRELIDVVRRGVSSDPLAWRLHEDRGIRPEVPTGVKPEAAAAYCAWAGGTIAPEALWEYAARGAGDERLYPWGDAPLTGAPEDCRRVTGFFMMSDQPMRVFNCGGRQPTPLDATPAGCTEFGVCGLAGNHDEFVHPAPARWQPGIGAERPEFASALPGPTEGGAEQPEAPDWAWLAADDPFALRTGWLLDVDALGHLRQTDLPVEQAVLPVRGGNFKDSLPVFYQSRARFQFVGRTQPKGFRCVFPASPEGRFVQAAPPAAEGGCGDGKVTQPEECDDGNRDDGDRCTSRCTDNVVTVEGGAFTMGYTEADLDAGLHLLAGEVRTEAQARGRAQRSQPATPLQVFSLQVMRTKVSQASFDRFVASEDFEGSGWNRDAPPEVRRDLEGLVRIARQKERRRPGVAARPGAPALVEADSAAAYCLNAGGTLVAEGAWEYLARSGGRDVAFPWGNARASRSDGCSAQGVCELLDGPAEFVELSPLTWEHEDVGGRPRLVSHLLGDAVFRQRDTGAFQGAWVYGMRLDPLGGITRRLIDFARGDAASNESMRATSAPREDALLVVRGGAGANARDRVPTVEQDERHAFRCGFIWQPR